MRAAARCRTMWCVKSAKEWKEHYRLERESLGAAGLRALVERAPDVSLPDHGALVFPHTHLRASGHFTAAVARAVVRSGRDTVLALGVLHRPRDGAESLRRVHSPGEVTKDEFSLDGFEALLRVCASVEEKPAPRLVARFPFLAGEKPEDMEGIEELFSLRARGAALVATADPIHHGAGYGTPLAEQRPRSESLGFARASIEEGLALLARRDYGAFLEQCKKARSDFRDAGVVVAALLSREGELEASVLDLDLADYSETLRAPDPGGTDESWVAGALIRFEASRARAPSRAASAAER